MQLKDGKKFLSLNTDDAPSMLQPGEVTDSLNIRMGSSDSQHESGQAETLQGEIEILINPSGTTTYYGDAIGGGFVYSGFDEIVIGTQIWMKKNWDEDYPGSKVQDDDESNADVYGRLYTWNQAMASDFCPAGYRVPTEADIDTLLTFIGGQLIGGGKLKEVGNSHWIPPNIGASDNYGFRALPGGSFDAVFALLGQKGLFWIADEYNPPPAIPLLDKDGNEYTSIIIGLQEWIIENFKVETYADDTAIPNLVTDDQWKGTPYYLYKDTYGALYNWYAATSAHGIAPTGWHLPTQAEFDTLYAEIGSTVFIAPLNARGFNISAVGSRRGVDGSFTILTQTGLWASTDLGAGNAFDLAFDFAVLGLWGNGANAYYTGHSIRCIKDVTGLTDGQTSTVTDIDGNTYNTICIGGQEWMSENLKAEHYNDGVTIPIITDNAAWAADVAGAMSFYNNEVAYEPTEGYCAYDNDKPTYKATYGLLYNKLAVDSVHGLAYLERDSVQEVGWRVPTETDFDTLMTFLGGIAIAGGKLKEIGTVHWSAPNVGATNESGFTALPGGGRDDTGGFDSVGDINALWSSTDDGLLAVALLLDSALTNAAKNSIVKSSGFSIRLMRDLIDIPAPPPEQYVIFTDGVSTWRKGVRNGAFNLDHTLTPLGFAGAEGIDWENVFNFT